MLSTSGLSLGLPVSEEDLDIAWTPCYHGFMIQSFADKGTGDVFDGKASKKARRACPTRLWHVAVRKLDMLDSAENIEDLRIPLGNRLESLSDNRYGQHSIRINDQYRICFAWSKAGPCDVEIVDYHT